MTKKGSTAKIAAIIVAVMLCVALLSTVLVACSGNTITFETNGGTAVDSVKKTVDQSPKTTRAGFKFDGWYTEKEFKNKVKFPYTAKGDVTLYAKWNEETDADRIKEFYNLLGSALENSIGFDGSKQFGIDVNLGAMGVGLNIKANVDPKNLSKVAANIEIVNGDTSVMNIFADDEFLYLVNDSMKKRLKDFNLEAMLSGVDFNNFSTTSYGSLVGSMLGLVLVPENSTYNKDGNTYTVEGSLAGIVEILGENVPAEIADLLAGMNLRIMATIEDNSIKALAITVVTQLGEVAITSDQLKLGNGLEPAITLPSKTDKEFDETYGLNFTINGTASLTETANNFAKSNLVSFDYEIRVDYNIFGVLRDTTGANKTGLEGIFGKAAQDSKIFIDVYHKCTEECGSFCETKMGDSKGSFLTLAYSPKDFDSNNFFVSFNTKYLLPTDLLSYVANLGDLPLDLNDLINNNYGEYMGLTIDPSALLASLVNDNTAIIPPPADTAAVAGFDIGSLLNPNVLQIVSTAFDLVKSINLGDTLTIGVQEILNLVDTISHDDTMNIATILQMFFSEYADTLSVSAVAEYGDPVNVGMNVFHKFMTISPEIGEYKDFTNGENDATPAKSIEWVKDKDGNVKINANGILNYDKDGKALPLSANEVELLLTTGKVEYTYERLNGKEGKSTVDIMSVIGLDYTKLNTPQEVTILTTPSDAGTFSGLLNMLGLSIPGSMFTTTITISETKGEITLTQDKDLANKYDPNKEYAYNDALNATFTATLTYANGVKKEIEAKPINAGTFYTSVFTSFGDETLTYNVFGTIIEKKIKAAKTVKNAAGDDIAPYTDNTPTINASITTGDTLTIGATEVKRHFVYNETDRTATVTVPTYAGTKVTKGLVPSITAGEASARGLTLTFNEAGTYTLEVYISKGITKTYNVTVKDPEAPIPGYKVDASYTDGKTIVATIGRTDQIGGDINAKVKVNIGNKDLVAGTDFKVIGGIGNDTFFLKANQAIAQSLTIELLGSYAKDTAFATSPATITVTTVDNKVICTSITPDIVANYTLKTTAMKAWNAEYTGQYTVIELNAKVADMYKVHSATDTFNIKVEVKTADAGNYSNVTDFKRGVYAGAIYDETITGPLSLDYTESGKITSPIGASHLYIVLPSSVTGAFDYKITVTLGETDIVINTATGSFAG